MSYMKNLIMLKRQFKLRELAHGGDLTECYQHAVKRLTDLLVAVRRFQIEARVSQDTKFVWEQHSVSIVDDENWRSERINETVLGPNDRVQRSGILLRLDVFNRFMVCTQYEKAYAFNKTRDDIVMVLKFQGVETLLGSLMSLFGHLNLEQLIRTTLNALRTDARKELLELIRSTGGVAVIDHMGCVAVPDKDIIRLAVSEFGETMSELFESVTDTDGTTILLLRD